MMPRFLCKSTFSKLYKNAETIEVDRRQAFLLDIFPHAKPARVGKTLSFSKSSLSLS